MAISQLRSKRKASGGKYQRIRKQKLYELGSLPSLTKIGERRVSKKRVLGRNYKLSSLSLDVANIYDPKTKKYEKSKIITVVESPANRHFIRRNIMTRGTVIKTEKGNARITNRPGQEGQINAISTEK